MLTVKGTAQVYQPGRTAAKTDGSVLRITHGYGKNDAVLLTDALPAGSSILGGRR